MNGRRMWIVISLLVSLSLPATSGVQAEQRMVDAYGQLPLYFIGNQGQADERVRYYVQQGGVSTFFTAEEMVMALRETTVRLRFVGANPAVQVVGTKAEAARVNYLIGNDPAQWRTDIPTYGEIVYRDLYPGVDLVYNGRVGTLKYSFVLCPGADAGSIRLAYRGADSLRLAKNGDLVIRSAAGEWRDTAPYAYQEIGGRRVEVETAFRLYGPFSYGFAVRGSYDPRYPLVIDPTLVYSTYLGGNGYDWGHGIAVDGAGRAYVTGETTSPNLPTASPLQAAHGGASYDAFVSVFSPAGNSLVYSTYLGGSWDDYGYGIAVDGTGRAYVTGHTYSPDFPTANPLQPAKAGASDAFVAVLDADGSALVYSTYLGGSWYECGYAIAVDGAGQAYVTGETDSDDLPTHNPFQLDWAGSVDAFVTVLNAAGSALVYSTYLGGSGREWGSYDIAVDGSGRAYVTGNTNSTDFPTANPVQSDLAGAYDAFVTVLDTAGGTLAYSTYLGGSNDEWSYGIAADGAGRAYVAGATWSADFPTANPWQPALASAPDAFVAAFTPSGSALVYATYLGGGGVDWGYGIAVDGASRAYVTGSTTSANFPTASPVQPALAGGVDVFVTALGVDGSALVYSTYLGGTVDEAGDDIAVDSTGRAYVTGRTNYSDFPTVNPFQSSWGGLYDVFVTKISAVPAVWYNLYLPIIIRNYRP